MKESYKTLFLSIISTAAALCALVMHTACENFALGNIDDSFEVAAIRPSLTLHRYDLDVVLGSGLTYQGNADISYKWYSNSVNSTEGGALVSTEVTCPISAQDMIGRHYYYVEITVDKDGKRTSKKSNVCVVTVLIPRYEQDNYVSGLYVNGAKDAQVIPNDTSVQEWLADNAQSNSEYAIVLDQNMSFETVTLASSSLNGASNVTVHLFGKGTEQTITPSLTSPVYPLFLVQGGVKLVLDKNITIDGLNINTSATYENLISVKDGGVLEMNDGSKVTKYGAVSNPAAEAPIGISGGSRFIMNGGDIVSNYSSYHSAGVNVENSSFEMHGGTISSNTSIAYMQGGGVSLWASSFEMTGGEISGNTCSNSTGGGVGVNHNYLDPPDRIYSSFTMSGNAKISGNMAPAGGGGVYVDEGCSLTMNGGAEISVNSGDYGGGVYVAGGNFTMNSGSIYKNQAGTSTGYGGGVYVAAGNFTMSGGVIGRSGGLNIAKTSGGGVYVAAGGSFTMNGGAAVSGNTAGDFDDPNHPEGGSGGGVYVTAGGNFTMSGGTAVSGNKAGQGGGVFFANGGTVSGGTISSNEADDSGGGVYFSNGSGTISGGVISGNTAASLGGGVCFDNGSGTISGGVISGNKTGNRGGGVCFVNSGTVSGGVISGNEAVNSGGGVNTCGSSAFTKNGGIIYGSEAGDELKNRVDSSGSGAAVFANSNSSTEYKHRNTTAGVGDDMDFANNIGWD